MGFLKGSKKTHLLMLVYLSLSEKFKVDDRWSDLQLCPTGEEKSATLM